MIEKLTLFDFQKHKKLVIQLDSKITVITGSSDQGKSSVLRALEWLCLNSLPGDAFVRRGAKQAKVKLKVDGVSITRVKGKGENLYALGEKEFRAFGNSVPDEIKDTFNLSSLNFQGQHDPSFWLSDTAGQVSRNLNSIINLEVIDSSLARVASDLKQVRTESSICETRLKDSQERLNQLSWVGEANQEYCKIEQYTSAIALRASRIENLTRRLSDRGNALESYQNALQRGTDAGNVLSLADTAKEASKRAESLQDLLEKRKTTQEILERDLPDFSEVEKAKTNYEKVRSQWDNLSRLLVSRKEVEQRLSHLRNAARQEETLLSQLLSREKVCPLCGTSLE